MILPYMYFEVTRACNHRCLQCFNNSKYKLNGEISTKLAIVALENFRSQGGKSLQLTGGDPFMRKDFREILRIAGSLSFDEIIVSTSGYLLNRERIGWLTGVATDICHSLDGFYQEHDVLRGVRCWEKSVDAIRLSVEGGFNTYVCSCLTPPLFEKLEAFLEFLIELGVNQVKFAQIGEVGRREVPEEWSARRLNDLEVYERVEQLRWRYRKDIVVMQSFSKTVKRPSVEVDGLVCDPVGDLYPVIGYLPRYWRCGTATPEWRIDEEKIAEYYDVVNATIDVGGEAISEGGPINWWTLLHGELESRTPIKVYTV